MTAVIVTLVSFPPAFGRAAKVRMAGLIFNAAGTATNALAGTSLFMPGFEPSEKPLVQRKAPKRRFCWKT